jgi:polysaccharide export outer membrane protein
MKQLCNWLMAAVLAMTFGAAGAAAAAEVPLGAGDVVKVSVYGSPDLTLETRVSEAGTITFPLIGQVNVGGLSVAAAEKKIGGMLESGGYIKKAQVNMLVTTLQSQQVSVLGQVNRPGPLSGRRQAPACWICWPRRAGWAPRAATASA